MTPPQVSRVEDPGVLSKEVIQEVLDQAAQRGKGGGSYGKIDHGLWENMGTYGKIWEIWENMGNMGKYGKIWENPRFNGQIFNYSHVKFSLIFGV